MWVSCAGVVAALSLSPPRLQAGNAERFVGSGTDGKVSVKFSAGVARWDAKDRRASIGFAPAAPGKGDRDAFLKTGWWADSMKQRAMNLGLEFNPGQDAASLHVLKAYYVAFSNYPGNPHDTPMTLNFSTGGSGVVTDYADTYRDWGWQQLSGDLRPGGRIRGHVAFARVYEYKKEHIGPIPYRWDLEFDAIMQ